jgi:hypothetical protein
MEREGEGEREREKGRERECVCMRVCQYVQGVEQFARSVVRLELIRELKVLSMASSR